MKKVVLLLVLSLCSFTAVAQGTKKPQKPALNNDIVQAITNYYFYSEIVGKHPFSTLSKSKENPVLFSYSYMGEQQENVKAVEVLQYDFVEGDITSDALRDMLVLITYQYRDSIPHRDLFVFLNHNDKLNLTNVIQVNSIDSDISKMNFKSINKGNITLLTQKRLLMKVDVAPEEQKEYENYEYVLRYLMDPKVKGAGNFVITAKRIIEE